MVRLDLALSGMIVTKRPLQRRLGELGAVEMGFRDTADFIDNVHHRQLRQCRRPFLRSWCQAEEAAV
jgi:hypothetical protein